MASRLRIMAQVVPIAGRLVGGLTAQTRYVPDKVGKWMLSEYFWYASQITKPPPPMDGELSLRRYDRRRRLR